MKVSIEDRAYIAGFVDGEGCITMHSHARKNTNGVVFISALIVVNTNIDIIKWIQERIGGIIVERKRRRDFHKTGYSLQLTRKDGLVKALEEIEPYLRIKKEQAQIVLSVLRCRTKNQNIFGDNEAFAIQKIRTLNKKGVAK